MPPKTPLVKIGDFIFKYRNVMFPVVLIALFFGFKTRDAYFGDEKIETIKDGFAVMVAFSGLILRSSVIGFRYIKRGGLNKKVYAEDLVTNGFFAVCRNPLYVGNFLIYAGVLMMHGSPAVFLIGMAFFMFVYTAIVAAEEYFLRNKFGAAYEEYCKDVPRWGMRLSRLPEATEGMQFNLKRALVKDYGTIANAVVTLSLLEIMEEVQWDTPPEIAVLLGIVGVAVLVALSVRYAKKHGGLQIT